MAGGGSRAGIYHLFRLSTTIACKDVCKAIGKRSCRNLNLARWESETFPAALFDKASRILRRRTYYGIFIFGQGPIF